MNVARRSCARDAPPGRGRLEKLLSVDLGDAGGDRGATWRGLAVHGPVVFVDEHVIVGFAEGRHLAPPRESLCDPWRQGPGARIRRLVFIERQRRRAVDQGAPDEVLERGIRPRWSPLRRCSCRLGYSRRSASCCGVGCARRAARRRAVPRARRERRYGRDADSMLKVKPFICSEALTRAGRVRSNRCDGGLRAPSALATYLQGRSHTVCVAAFVPRHTLMTRLAR
jgi:hypothetical protein